MKKRGYEQANGIDGPAPKRPAMGVIRQAGNVRPPTGMVSHREPYYYVLTDHVYWDQTSIPLGTRNFLMVILYKGCLVRLHASGQARTEMR